MARRDGADQVARPVGEFAFFDEELHRPFDLGKVIVVEPQFFADHLRLHRPIFGVVYMAKNCVVEIRH